MMEEKISPANQAWLDELMQIINNNLHLEDFLVDDIATKLNMGRTTFYAKVKELTGETPATLLRNARLELAYELLNTVPDIRVAEAMHQVGFNDAKHFAAIFKEYFGIVPQSLKK